MMTKPTVEELLEKSVNRYELVNAISKRARQIVDGNPSKIKADENSKITVAALEFQDGYYKIVRDSDDKN